MTDPTTGQTGPSRRTGLRDEIAAALEAADYRMDMRRGDLADAVMPVLYRKWPWLRADADRPLSPFFEHPECGFRWHGRDGMDVPMRDGQPVCPRCELRRVEKLLNHRERRNDELRAECKRRGKNVLEYAEKNRALERDLDRTREQLGAEILRSGQAEAELRRMAAETRDTDPSPRVARLTEMLTSKPSREEAELTRIALTRDQLAAILAHHADVLAAQLRTDTARDAWIAAERLDAHAAALTAERETPAVRELLDATMTFDLRQNGAGS